MESDSLGGNCGSVCRGKIPFLEFKRGGGRSVELWVIEAWGGSWAGNVAVTRCG